jgi:class 3 adenylate cyclase/tetratricopeptide (TPR) repeat protein
MTTVLQTDPPPASGTRRRYDTNQTTQRLHARSLISLQPRAAIREVSDARRAFAPGALYTRTVQRCSACSRENPADARFCNSCGAPLTVDQAERRKTATLLFCDVAGSTRLAERLDPEAVRELMLEYFHEMRAAIDSYGGTVEKFIGDAVVGVFGVPVAHEDDALRGTQAALEMQKRIQVLNARLDRNFGVRLLIRVGVNTGEVAVGNPAAREGFVSGDAVNVAARLEQAARPGEILLSETTFGLVGSAVEAEAIPPASVKGKAEPLRTYRLVGVAQEHLERERRPSPFVGRDAEVSTLVGLLDGVIASRTPRRALVIGEAGVGKSRLVETALASVTSRVSVLPLRCLPYGEHITYLPVVQLVRQVVGVGESEDDPLATRDRIRDVFGTSSDAHSAAAILAQVLGVVEGAASADEIAWAVRRFVETLAARNALVILVDDLHWAEGPFVELLSAVANRAAGPILVLGLARPEFAAGRPDWPVDLRLGPLTRANSEELVRQLVPAKSPALDSRETLLRAAGGNPLFLTELVAYVGTDGDGSEVPPTLEALLNARLDARPVHERHALECAAVEGEVFHLGALLALAAPEDSTTINRALESLLDDALIRPGRSSFDDETAFQFHHLLVRDAAYRGTAKRRRADLHLRFARWLGGKLGTRLPEISEIVGYHLEQAWLLRAELGPIDDETIAVGVRASSLLGGAARRSLARGDAAAALSLYTRAVNLAPDGSARIELELGEGSAAREAGVFELAEELLSAVERKGVQAGLDATVARARLELALLEHSLRPHEAASRLKPVAESALATFEACDDEHGRAYALAVLAHERWVALRCAEAEHLLEQALVHAEGARDDRLTASILTALARAVLVGPTPADEAAQRCETLLARARRIGPATAASIRSKLGAVEATRGNAERARELVDSSVAVLLETASPLPAAASYQYAGMAEVALGNPARAEAQFRRAFDALDRLGERSVASSVAAQLSRALVDLARHDEAGRLAWLALEWSSDRDVATHAYAHSTLALVSAAQGAPNSARRDAQTAVELASATDFSNLRGDTLLDLAAVLHACGDDAGAHRAAADAHACYLAKGNLAAAARAEVLVPG